MASATSIKDFTKGNITRQLIVFAWPLFLSNLLQIVYNMVDMVVVGKVIGKVGTSAVAVGGDVTHYLTFVAIGFSTAGQILIARYIGAKERDQLGTFVGTMTGFLLAVSIVISMIGLFFRHGILQVMNTPEEAYGGALSYSTICMAGLVFIYGYNIGSAILRGMGDSKHPFIFVSIAAVLNVVLDILFVAVMGMGAGGAALATVIGQAVSFLCCAFFLFKNRGKFELDLSIRKFIKWDVNMLSELIKLGIPIAIKSAAVQTSKLFVNSWINSYGVAVSAFAGIASKVSSISNLFSNAMNTAGGTLVGQNIAAGEFGRVKTIMIRLGTITFSIAAILSILVCTFPNQIFGLFINEGGADVLAIAPGYLPIACMIFFASAARAIMNGLINGSGNARVNFATAILDGIVFRIGLSLLFGLALGMKHYGFWLGDALASYTPFFIGLVFYLSGEWKKGKKIKDA